MWADTTDKWHVPGLTYHDGMASYDITDSRLIDSFARLQEREKARGRWTLGGEGLAFGEEMQTHFPVVGRFVDDAGTPAASCLSPDEVAALWEPIFV